MSKGVTVKRHRWQLPKTSHQVYCLNLRLWDLDQFSSAISSKISWGWSFRQFVSIWQPNQHQSNPFHPFSLPSSFSLQVGAAHGPKVFHGMCSLHAIGGHLRSGSGGGGRQRPPHRLQPLQPRRKGHGGHSGHGRHHGGHRERPRVQGQGGSHRTAEGWAAETCLSGRCPYFLEGFSGVWMLSYSDWNILGLRCFNHVFWHCMVWIPGGTEDCAGKRSEKLQVSAL